MCARVIVVGVASVAGVVGVAGASINQGTVTADNHYAVYVETAGGMTLVGGNELTYGGNPGAYNWSVAETHELPVSFTRLFVAAWGDDSVAEGFLGQFEVMGQTVLTGDAQWRVYATGLDLDTGDAWPTVNEMVGHVGMADGLDAWEAPTVVGWNSGGGTWGQIDGISSQAEWVWGSGGSGGDLHVFSYVAAVPSPGAALLGAMCPMVAVRRRRR